MCSLWMMIGRIFVSAIFIFGGIGKFMYYEGSAAFMASKGMTMIPFFLYSAALVELLGGLSLLFGYMTRYGAIMLMLFLIPVTYIFHDFWNLSGQVQTEQMIHFLSNLAIFGGLMYVSCCGAGKCSVDGCCSCS